MSNCLFYAIDDALRFYFYVPSGVFLSSQDYGYYKAVKAEYQANPEGYTEQPLVPHIVKHLVARWGLTVEMQHRLYTPEAARQVAWSEQGWGTWLATYKWPDWGERVEELTLRDAIYLQVTPSQHAYYRSSPVTRGHFMALKLVPIGDRHDPSHP